MTQHIAELVAQKRVIVCCGAGGVGKTSVAAALALSGARKHRRVLVVTIDPSKRLAEVLGVVGNPSKPVTITKDRLEQIGIEPPGSVDAWMLDPQAVSDDVVRRLSNTAQDAERLLNNRIYKSVTAMVAGMQEYTAVEAMHSFVREGRYELVILDTPPSRNALHFLQAPGRIARFLDGRIFRFFLPNKDGLVRKAASAVLNKVMDVVFGQETRVELLTFFELFSMILSQLNRNASEMQAFFRDPRTAFVVVTSPAQESLEEAHYFTEKTRNELKLPLAGYVLNRSIALDDGRTFPDAKNVGNALAAQTLGKLQRLAQQELEQTHEHRALLTSLEGRMDRDGFAQALPYLPDGVQDLPSIKALVDAMSA